MQYAAAAFARLAAAGSITLSMSRTANPYDSALAERLPGTAAPALRAACGRLSRSARLVATLKAECFADSLPPTRAAAELMAFDSIETFFNPYRRHSSLGQRSPCDFESQMFPHNQNIPTH
ncbi:MAG: IS3 family transposase [Chthoniobacteraceae bacterium]